MTAPNEVPGFESVDSHDETAMLVAAMVKTAQWPSVQRLRMWERERLVLRAGDNILDVGCGAGDVAIGLTHDVGPTGSVTAIDLSEAMLDAARAHAATLGAVVTFRTGAADAIDAADGSYDAVRCERVLQWLPDPASAIAEMCRVLRPGGRLSLIDTDWRTLQTDVDDTEAAAAIAAALVESRGPAAGIGGHLVNACRDAGLVDVAVRGDVHTATRWDPDTEIGPSGLFPPALILGGLADAGAVDPEMVERFVSELEERGRAGRLFMSLTMFAVNARRP